MLTKISWFVLLKDKLAISYVLSTLQKVLMTYSCQYLSKSFSPLVCTRATSPPALVENNNLIENCQLRIRIFIKYRLNTCARRSSPESRHNKQVSMSKYRCSALDPMQISVKGRSHPKRSACNVRMESPRIFKHIKPGYVKHGITSL